MNFSSEKKAKGNLRRRREKNSKLTQFAPEWWNWNCFCCYFNFNFSLLCWLNLISHRLLIHNARSYVGGEKVEHCLNLKFPSFFRYCYPIESWAILSLSRKGKRSKSGEKSSEFSTAEREISSQERNDDDGMLKWWDENFPIYYSNRTFHLEVGGVRWVWLWLFSWELEGCEVAVDILCLSFSTTLIWRQLQLPSSTICSTFTLSMTQNFISYSKLSGYSIFDFLRIENQLTSQQHRNHRLNSFHFARVSSRTWKKLRFICQLSGAHQVEIDEKFSAVA